MRAIKFPLSSKNNNLTSSVASNENDNYGTLKDEDKIEIKDETTVITNSYCHLPLPLLIAALKSESANEISIILGLKFPIDPMDR